MHMPYESTARIYIDHYDSGDLMVWAGITLDGRTHLYVFGTVTAVRYRDEVFQLYVCLFMGAVGSDFILMGDKVRHIELIRSMKMRIFSKRISQTSSDTLGRMNATPKLPLKTIQDLKTELLNEWD
ncbi:transposable element Tcb2 transposase [Trichonephila clavipes]|nr:transposable element Tcb2 transposase [Trichonephila clavipes]